MDVCICIVRYSSPERDEEYDSTEDEQEDPGDYCKGRSC